MDDFFEVWMEGYAATGHSSKATFYGLYQAKTFKDAVIEAVRSCLEELPFDEENLAYWGCKFYDNEPAARSTFG